MKALEFPIIGTKVKGLDNRYDLNNPVGRRKYYLEKVGDEIRHLRKYFQKNSFIAYMIGKKNSGKGTYSHQFIEIFGKEVVNYISVGDLVREVHGNWDKYSKSKKFEELKKVYRGYISLDDAVKAMLGRLQTQARLPTEFILALLKLKIREIGNKTILIDGLPREKDQVSYSLFFRDLVNYSNVQDIFILIDLPEEVIEERMKDRVICPLCQNAKNSKHTITSKVKYDPKTRKIYLVCDNPSCTGARMVPKERDNLGIESIRSLLKMDEEVLKTALKLHGIPKVLLRNHISVKEAKDYFDNYEFTPTIKFKWNSKKRRIEMFKKPWIMKDDSGMESYSLMPAPVVVSMIKQLVEVLAL